MQKQDAEFFSEAQANQEFEQPWTISSNLQKASCAIPTEFGGAGGGFSPEDLFLQSTMNCFIGTFKVVARLSKLSFSEIHVKGKLTVGKNSENRTFMKAVHLQIAISNVDRPDRLETIVAKVMRDGFILNSIKSELTWDLHQKSA
jgi:organic hydroperoxide reductase OsmC/OhrA